MIDGRITDFEAIAFDYDGVLADSISVHTTARFEAYRTMSERTGDHRYAQVLPQLHQKAHHHGTTPEQINAWLLAEACIIESADELESPEVQTIVDIKNEIYAKHTQEGHTPMYGALDIVSKTHEALDGRIAIVTTAAEDEVQPYLARHHLVRKFSRDRLIFGTDVTNKKPDPEAYERAIEQLGVSEPGKMLVIEDTPQGIEAANRAGAITMAVATTYRQVQLRELEGVQAPDIITASLGSAIERLFPRTKLGRTVITQPSP